MASALGVFLAVPLAVLTPCAHVEFVIAPVPNRVPKLPGVAAANPLGYWKSI